LISLQRGLKTIEELAEYLQISKSTIYHWVSQDKIVARKIGNQLRFDMEDINDLTREGKLGKQENTKPNFRRTKKRIHHFTFPSSLEPFTNVFVQKGYLDKGYDALMNDRFSESPKLGEDAILWKRDAVSLITFIYLADRLGFIDKSSSADTREHNSSSEEEKEDGDEAKDNEAKEIKYQVLVMENFKIMDGALSKSKLSRAWKGVNNAINKLREQVADRENIKTEDVKKALTRKEAIESYNRPKYIRHRI
jgi:excisionase family DNA binding protein